MSWLKSGMLGMAAFLLIGGDVFAQAHFTRGDSNFDGSVDLSDGVNTLNWLFIGGATPPCLDASDSNDDGSVDLSDASATFNFLFLGGSAPAQPYPGFEADPTDNDSLTCMGPAETITGDITADRTLVKGKVYRLVSAVFVKSGATLRIPAGVTLLGDSESDGLLVVERGGKIEAVGSRTQPVVFTSDKPVGQRGRGDWGGLVLLGRGDNNLPGKEGEAEGLEGQLWGGGATPDNADSSGRLSFVRVEFGGTEISPDNEINSISVFGVGSGTQMDHILVKYNLDDGVEWFGGDVGLKYAIALGIGDDSFDYSFGWSGAGQFWVAQQRGDDADAGFEVDNSESEFGARPLTTPQIANLTLLGDPDTNEGSESTRGLLIRRGAGTQLYNGIIAGFKTCGLDIDNAPTFLNGPSDNSFVINHCMFYLNGPGGETHWCDGDDGTPLPDPFYTAQDFLTTMNSNNSFPTTSPVVDPFNLAAPNFKPQGDVSSTFDPVSLGSFFDAAPYKGAVAPTGADWTQDPWISYLAN